MQSTRGTDEIFIPLKKSHSGNVQQNVVDVVVLAVSSSRSNPILRHKWRRLREMHTYGAAMSPPSLVQQVWWRDRLDLQHDGVVLMVESFCGRASPMHSRERERCGGSAVGRRLGLEWGASHPPFFWKVPLGFPLRAGR